MRHSTLASFPVNLHLDRTSWPAVVTASPLCAMNQLPHHWRTQGMGLRVNSYCILRKFFWSLCIYTTTLSYMSLSMKLCIFYRRTLNTVHYFNIFLQLLGTSVPYTLALAWLPFRKFLNPVIHGLLGVQTHQLNFQNFFHLCVCQILSKLCSCRPTLTIYNRLYLPDYLTASHSACVFSSGVQYMCRRRLTLKL